MFIVEMVLITYIMAGCGGGLVLVVLLITGIKIYRSRQQTPAMGNTGETGKCQDNMETCYFFLNIEYDKRKLAFV